MALLGRLMWLRKESSNEHSVCIIKGGEFFDQPSDCWHLRKNFALWIAVILKQYS